MADTTRLARTLQESSRSLGVHTDTLRRAALRGDLRVIRISKRILVPEDELQRVLREGLKPATR